MKKLILSILVLASMIACTSQETKKADASTEDKDTGTWTSLDAKTIKVRQLLEAYAKNDSSVIYEIMADTVKIRDQFAGNQENGKTKVNPGGRAAFVKGEQSHHLLFSDISVTTKNIKTFVQSTGETGTGYWGMWSGTGRFSKKKITCPVHIFFYWKDDKIVSEYRIFDPTLLLAEVTASQNK
jgi:hypothetical protein